jgi:hypothetical protein
MLGHMSGAYSARVSRDLSLSSRFDFNVYSYESEWTMGAEWWMRSSLTEDDTGDNSAHYIAPLSGEAKGEVHGVVKARASTNNVSFLASTFDLLFTPPGRFPDVGRATAQYAGQSRGGL